MTPLVCGAEHHATLDSSEAWTTNSPSDEDHVVTGPCFTSTDDTIAGTKPASTHLPWAHDSEVRLTAILT